MSQKKIICLNNNSDNYIKHVSKNPLQRWLINKFHDNISYLIRKTKAQKIFEVGCGEGFSSKVIISSKDCQFTGMDISLKSLILAQKKCPDGNFFQGTIYRLPFFDSSFDLVVSLEVLEHLENPSKALFELCRVSSEWLILSVPNEPFFCLANFIRGKNVRSWGNDPGHVNHWSPHSFVHFVNRHCKVISRILSFPWIILLCKTRG
jgi:2-polyprenyl-3-methyl-5-hydroxy-6-metoxy-1,4-benzoquinol methylase